MPPANDPASEQHDRSVYQPFQGVPHGGTPQPGLSVRRRLDRRAPVPDAASFRRTGSGARRPGPGAIRSDPGRQSPDRDVDVGHGPESPARPRLGRPGQPTRCLRRAAGGGGILRGVLRRSRARGLGGTRRDDPGAGGDPRRGRGRPGSGSGDHRPLGRGRGQRMERSPAPARRLRGPAGGHRARGARGGLPWLLRAVQGGERPLRRRAGAPGPPAGGAGRGAFRRRSTCRASPPTCRWPLSWCTIGRTRRCAGRRARRSPRPGRAPSS